MTPGEMVGVGGRNGAGKSTLALAAAAFIPRVVRARVGGVVRIAGEDVAATPARDLPRRVGVVFSTPSNQLSGSKLTVREELAFGLENLGIARGAMDARIEGTLAALGIAHLAERLPTALSGGEQQRVAIAAILCMGPGLLVLDEPTAQLDPAGTRAVAELLARRAADGISVLVAEHRAAVLGQVLACGPRWRRRGRDRRTGCRPWTRLRRRAGIAVPAVASLALPWGCPHRRPWTSQPWRGSWRRGPAAHRGGGWRDAVGRSADGGGAPAVAPWQAVRDHWRGRSRSATCGMSIRAGRMRCAA